MSGARRSGPSSMGKVTCQISISLDGFAAGPAQSVEDPPGKVGDPTLEPVAVVASPAVTHVSYRVVR
jgi:hypothetical protein